MKKIVFLLFVSVTVLNAYCQNLSRDIEGIVMSDGISVSDVHILNLNSGIGAVSNVYGEFVIPVQENDSLFFSSLNYENRVIIFTPKIFNTKSIEVLLVTKRFKLDEVSLDTKLSGYLYSDLKKVKGNNVFSRISPEALNFSTEGLKPLTILDDDARISTSDNSSLGGPSGQGGMDLFAIAGFVLSPLENRINEIGKHKRTQKYKEKQLIEKSKKALDLIRKDFGDDFFLTIGLPKDHINTFIEFCSSENIGRLFVEKNKFEIIDIFLDKLNEYKYLNNL